MTTSHTTVDELRYRLSGGLHEPGSPEYADACALFNSMVDKRPRFVARAAAPDDVVAALAFAQEQGLEIAVRAGGHSVTGASLVDDGLVLDIRGISDVEVDAERRIGRVGGGATWAQVDAATQEHGLATPGGRVSSTGVGGLTLGGGSGWLERKHGLTVDNLLSVELVTADGELVRASEDENSELFWALRGGGGNFGVVTTFEFRLHPVGPQVLAGLVVHPVERGRELMKLWRDLMLDAPEGLSLAFIYMAVPEEPDFPEHMQGKMASWVAGMYDGPIEEGEAVLKELREFGPPSADFFEPMDYKDFQQFIDDPPGFRNYWTAESLHELPDEAIDALADRSEPAPPGTQLFMVGWGGAVPRLGEGTSVPGRDAKFIVHPLMMWEDPAQDEQMMAIGRAYRDDVRAFSTGDAYLNFIGDEGAERIRDGLEDAERMARVKAEWDPRGVFRGTHPVPAPASA